MSRNRRVRDRSAHLVTVLLVALAPLSTGGGCSRQSTAPPPADQQEVTPPLPQLALSFDPRQIEPDKTVVEKDSLVKEDNEGGESVAAQVPQELTSLDEIPGKVEIPPPWLDAVSVNFDTTKPWNKAWDHIEKLLESATLENRRRAVKLAYLYDSAGRAKEGYPATVYFLAGQYAWSLREFDKLEEKNNAAYMRIASCHLHFKAHDQALDALEMAIESIPPEPPWNVFRQAQVHEAKGDVFADLNDVAQAQAAFNQALRLYRQANLPAKQQHVVARSVAGVESKLEMLDRSLLANARLRDGTFWGEAFGYTDTIRAELTVDGGRIVDVRLEHQEKADLGAKRIMPARIIETQGLEVDAITGATITSNAIKAAAFNAYKKAAGLTLPN